ncbi:U3 small nucleolar RNA-associated protein 6-domain-containing protein [Hypoxylon fragiforme]|uniref:U3 small nucleolar RNA-associated protein 6-domain-containing protein n=1 Tax=Hypoxylon fragiforme TaxID=63214 RepID=UPI0020C601D0|nr:U3 small nucleolar RNA-associated protein 6-domain-containing protein [Hypoxylon fragiforme]KAI2603449.1 U3 small nucleolar RNA-associated protein 6-domain-containing protein [Hypoxylon fragiforme]
MAGVPEKARFYLERAVPQLREFESKGIFTTDEIRSLVRKRTDFEHIVLSPGNKATDWLNYAAWEKSLESLRAKRCKRLKVRTSSKHTGEGRVFGILDRAVNRHPGNVELWKEYLAYAKDMKASKRYRKVMTRALRMHPAKPELWVMAGRRSANTGDMQAARGFFMRGARFCTRDATVWLEYARCEMEWLQRMDAKKGKKGGAEKALQEQAEQSDDEIKLIQDSEDEEADEDGQLTLPDPGTSVEAFSEDTAKKLESNPALDGAIPLAIFDISKKQPFFNATVAEQFFNVFAISNPIPAQARIIQHVLDTMTELYPNDPATDFCHVRQPLVNIDINSPLYPKALREALARLKSSLSTTVNKASLTEKVKSWIEPILASEDLDLGIRTVLEHTLRTLPKP